LHWRRAGDCDDRGELALKIVSAKTSKFAIQNNWVSKVAMN